MHCSLGLIVLPLYDFQHILNNPALRINRHRSLIETVLMSLIKCYCNDRHTNAGQCSLQFDCKHYGQEMVYRADLLYRTLRADLASGSKSPI
jgi:hypothetical protein